MPPQILPPSHNQVTYIKGSPLNSADLVKARDSSADAVFVLSSELGHPALSEGFDMEAAALACRSVKMSSPWTPVYCQVGTSQPRAYLHKGIAVRKLLNCPRRRGVVVSIAGDERLVKNISPVLFSSCTLRQPFWHGQAGTKSSAQMY